MIDAFTAAPTAAVLRWVAFVAASVTCGITACHLLLPRSVGPGHRRPLASLVRLSAWLVLLSGAGRMAQQALSFASEPAEAWGMVGILLSTPWGWAWAAQCTAAALLAIRPSFVAAPSARAGTLWQVILTAAILVAPAFQGHAIGAPQLAALAVVADILHLVAAGFWIGTLFVIVVALLPGREASSVGQLLRAFSPWALASAATLGATGTFASWLHVQTLPFLWGSGYGRMVLVKVALVGAVGVLGAINWRRLTPQLARPGGVARLATSARTELILAVLVLAATAVLVATPLPGE